MKTGIRIRCGLLGLLSVSIAGLPVLLAACDREVTHEKKTESKVVDTPDGPKKVTETKESTTVKEKKEP